LPKSNKSIENLDNVPYQQALGSMMYLAVCTRPDVYFAMTYLSQFNTCFTREHWVLLKRVLKYLNTTKDVCIVYSQSNDQLEGFSDADCGGNLERKSFSGFVFKLSGAAISWRCKKQRTVDLSTTEVDYMALSETAKEAIFLRKLWSEMCNKEITIPVFLIIVVL
jgi:hypothetical protein